MPPKPKKRAMMDWLPADTVESMVELAVNHPDGPLDELAAARGIPIGLARQISREPRFALLVARRGADIMARDALPRAVRLVNDIVAGRIEASATTRLDAAKTILRHTERYLDGHLASARQEQDLADMTLDELRDLVDAGEARLASAAQDVSAPDSAPLTIEAIDDAVRIALEPDI